MPYQDTPESMEALTEYNDLIKEAQKYENESLLYHIFLLQKIREYSQFQEISGNRILTFGQYCKGCAKFIEKNIEEEYKNFVKF